MPGHAFLWAELTTKDFEGLDPESTIAILPVAATEQHGPHLPVMTDVAIAEGMLALPEAAIARRPARAGAADPVDRQVERAHPFARHADAVGRYAAARAGRDRRERAPRGPAQAGAGQFARRQRLGDRDRGARASRALRHARGRDALALVRTAGGHVRRSRSRSTASMPATSRPR